MLRSYGAYVPLIKRLSGHKFISLILFALCLGVQAASIALPQGIRILENDLSERPLRLAMGYFSIFIVLIALGNYFTSIISVKLQERLAYEERLSVIDNYLSLSLEAKQSIASSTFITLLSNDCESLKTLATVVSASILPGLVGVIATIVMLFNVDSHMMIVTTLLIVPFALLVSVLGWLVSIRSKAVQVSTESAIAFFGAVSTNLVILHATNALAWARENTIARAINLRSTKVSQGRLLSFVAPLNNLFSEILVIGVLLSGLRRIADGNSSPTNIVVFMAYIFVLMGPLGQLVSGFTSTSVALAAYRRIREFHNRTHHLNADVTNPAPRDSEVRSCELDVESDNSGLVAKDVKFQYRIDRESGTHFGPWNLLGEVGSVTLVTGPNGAGKSTLLKTLAGLYSQVEGMVSVNGVDVSYRCNNVLQGSVQLFPQGGPVFPESVYENVVFGDHTITVETITSLIRIVGLNSSNDCVSIDVDTLIGDGRRELSGGERQRIAWIRMLLSDATCLLMDEPTAGVDEIGIDIFCNIINQICSDRVVVIATHDERLIDRLGGRLDIAQLNYMRLD